MMQIHETNTTFMDNMRKMDSLHTRLHAYAKNFFENADVDFFTSDFTSEMSPYNFSSTDFFEHEAQKNMDMMLHMFMQVYLDSLSIINSEIYKNIDNPFTRKLLEQDPDVLKSLHVIVNMFSNAEPLVGENFSKILEGEIHYVELDLTTKNIIRENFFDEMKNFLNFFTSIQDYTEQQRNSSTILPETIPNMQYQRKRENNWENFFNYISYTNFYSTEDEKVYLFNDLCNTYPASVQAKIKNNFTLDEIEIITNFLMLFQEIVVDFRLSPENIYKEFMKF